MSRRDLSNRFVKDDRMIHWRVVPAADALSSGNAKDYFHVNKKIVGYKLYDIDVSVDDPSSSSGLSMQLYSMGDSSDLLSTPVTIDVNEYSSTSAATPPVLNSTYFILKSGDRLRADVDANGNGAKGLVYHLYIRNY